MKKFHQEACVLTHAEPSHADSDALMRCEKQTLSAFHGSLVWAGIQSWYSVTISGMVMMHSRVVTA